jgi:hypothetical protein
MELRSNIAEADATIARRQLVQTCLNDVGVKPTDERQSAVTQKCRCVGPNGVAENAQIAKPHSRCNGQVWTQRVGCVWSVECGTIWDFAHQQLEKKIHGMIMGMVWVG